MNWIENTLLAADVVFVLLTLWIFLLKKQKENNKKSLVKRLIWIGLVCGVNAAFVWNDPNSEWALRLPYLPFCFFIISFLILDWWRDCNGGNK